MAKWSRLAKICVEIVEFVDSDVSTDSYSSIAVATVAAIAVCLR